LGILRRVLLAGSRSAWLRAQATRRGFVRRSVSRFMPGERLEDALAAAAALRDKGASAILTRLGENVTDAAEADEVTRHYLDVIEAASARGLDAQISVKPTQLGLDLDRAVCQRNLETLVAAATAAGSFVWIDMEASGYVDATLDLFRRARAGSARVGVCLQAYLRRTAADLEALRPLQPAIRLVKGAYMEPPAVAFPDKKDVDENFFTLATSLLGAERPPASLLGIATHDARLVDRLRAFIARARTPREAYEFEMLYGIQRPLQSRLVAQGERPRVLVSYGEYWFPWYMRRLAERPANVWFVVRNLLG
jgi:proline dehydrogenase